MPVSASGSRVATGTTGRCSPTGAPAAPATGPRSLDRRARAARGASAGSRRYRGRRTTRAPLERCSISQLDALSVRSRTDANGAVMCPTSTSKRVGSVVASSVDACSSPSSGIGRCAMSVWAGEFSRSARPAGWAYRNRWEPPTPQDGVTVGYKYYGLHAGEDLQAPRTLRTRTAGEHSPTPDTRGHR